MTAFDIVARRLTEETGYAPRNGSGDWRCPAHDDHKASLSVTNGDGKVLLCCQAGCDTDRVLEALHLSRGDLFDSNGQVDGARTRIVATYGYVDEEGHDLFEVVRFDPKDFRQRRRASDGSWDWRLGNTRRVLYRLPAVRAAVAEGRTVFVVEGEKDVHAIEAAGEVATCNPGGAGKWRRDYIAALAGAEEIVVVADQDEPGRAHARSVVEALAPVASRIILAEPTIGKDVAEHLGAGRTLDELAVLKQVGGEDRTDSTKHEGGDLSQLFRRWTMPELLDAPRSFEWRARGLMVHPTYGMLAGDQKSLKSYIAMVFWVGIAAGVQIFGNFEVDQAVPVIAYVGEGGRGPWTRRLERVAATMGVNPRDIPLFLSFDVAPIASAVFTESLARDLAEVRPGLVGLDPFYAFHGTKTDARNLYEEGSLLTGASTRCLDAGASFQVVNHNNQTGSGYGLRRITMAGAAEWCDSWWLVSHREEPDVDEGRFRLLLEVGSRQWGGSVWELDLNLGRFNQETGEHDGDICWDLRRAVGGRRGPYIGDRVLAQVTAHPWELTRDELVQSIGGRQQAARLAVDDLLGRGQLATMKVGRKRSDGRSYTVWAHGVSSTPGTEETEHEAP